jgi:hypothetical protein
MTDIQKQIKSAIQKQNDEYDRNCNEYRNFVESNIARMLDSGNTITVEKHHHSAFFSISKKCLHNFSSKYPVKFEVSKYIRNFFGILTLDPRCIQIELRDSYFRGPFFHVSHF